MEKFNINLKSKKKVRYITLYLVFIFIMSFSMLNLDDYLHPINYILIMLASSILGIFCIIYYHREREREREQ
jgi:hypothetical protein